MAVDTPEELFEYQLRGIYYVERELVDILDELQTSATDSKLVDGFSDHREETETHVERLETVFDVLDLRAEERNVPSLDALREEKRNFDAESSDTAVQNAFYGHIGRKTEHLELTTYDGLLDLADAIDVDSEAIDLLEQNRDEDRDALDDLESVSEGSEFESFVSRLL